MADQLITYLFVFSTPVDGPGSLPTIVFEPGDHCRSHFVAATQQDCALYSHSRCKNSLCRRKRKSPPPRIEQEFREAIVFEHNRLRQRLAHGHTHNGQTGGKRLPAASNMHKLVNFAQILNIGIYLFHLCTRFYYSIN